MWFKAFLSTLYSVIIQVTSKSTTRSLILLNRLPAPATHLYLHPGNLPFPEISSHINPDEQVLAVTLTPLWTCFILMTFFTSWFNLCHHFLHPSSSICHLFPLNISKWQLVPLSLFSSPWLAEDVAQHGLPLLGRTIAGHIAVFRCHPGPCKMPATMPCLKKTRLSGVNSFNFPLI